MSRRGLRRSLLVSVSVAALFIATAHADENNAMKGRVWLEISGMAPFWQGTADQFSPTAAELSALWGIPWATVSGSPSIKPRRGLSFSGEIGYQFAESPWSVRFRVGHGFSKKRRGGIFLVPTYYPSYVVHVTASKKERLTFIDFEAGRDIGIGGAEGNATLFAGLRFARFRAKENGNVNLYYYGYPYYGSAGSIKRTFTGIGPRVGLNFRMPLNEVFAFRLDAAGALLFGKRKFRSSGSFAGTNRSKSTVVPNVDAFAGIAWTPASMPNLQLTVGYGVNAYFNMVDRGGPLFANGSGDRIIHGPRIGLRINFDPGP